MTTTTENIASELILHKDLVEHQNKLLIQLEKKVETLRDLADSYKEQRDSYMNLFNNLRTEHQRYIDKVKTGLDSLMESRIFKI
jgi:hypothetical protein